MRVLLIGHTVGIKRCIEALSDSGHEAVAVFTHPRAEHQADLDIFEKRADQFGDYAFDVFSTHETLGVDIHEYNDLSSSKDLSRIKAYQPDAIITIGCRDILKREFIESFKYVMNLHPFNLPLFRGAGIDSWMILQGYSGTTQKSTCHFISHRIDAGNIICQAPYPIKENATPLDIFKVRIDTLPSLLLTALDMVVNPSFEGLPQDESLSFYYPRLNTHRDGRIDFEQWDGQQIVRLVRAFSYPYDGAWLTLGERKIHALSAKFEEVGDPHPFSYGLIYRRSHEGLSVFVRGGVVHLSDLEENNAQHDPLTVKVGKFANR